MSDTVQSVLIGRIQQVNRSMIAVTEDLSEAQITWQPSAMAPPIGWHLWHCARFADVLQASFPNRLRPNGRALDPERELWRSEDLALRWELDRDQLGWQETGATMAVDATREVAGVGKDLLLDYARRTFAAVDEAVAVLDLDQLLTPRISIQEFTIQDGVLHSAPGRETIVAADLNFHLAHTNRHLGMIEGLRGVILHRGGTASV